MYFRAVTVFGLLLICSVLSGCWLAGLMRFGARAGFSQSMVISVARTSGGSALAVRTIAQSNIGSVIAADANLMRVASRPLSVELRSLNHVERGRVFVNAREVNVVLEGRGLRVVREGRYARHYDTATGKQVSYTHYSSDLRRLDYRLWNTETQRFEFVMYGLRDPRTGSVAFFGKNHSYLGNAFYRSVPARQTAGASAEAGAVAAAALLFIEFQDYEAVPPAQSCADELVLVRRTHFNQGEIPDNPEEFWNALFGDCPEHSEVRVNFAQFRLERIMALTNRQEKRATLVKFLRQFPENNEAANLLRMLDELPGRES